MNVLQVCAEIFPLLKTGGLADVAGALPPALSGVVSPSRMQPAFRTFSIALSGSRTASVRCSGAIALTRSKLSPSTIISSSSIPIENGPWASGEKACCIGPHPTQR